MARAVGEQLETFEVASGGVTLAVERRGPRSAPVVVLVHGYPDTRALWSLVAPLLADRFHVVAYDVRGFGASTAPPSASDYRIGELVGDAAAVIEAVAPGRRVHLVGHDWGAIA